MYKFGSFATPEHELSLDGVSSHFHYPVSQDIPRSSSRIFDFDWPNAVEHPFFYVGIYSAIGLASVFVSLSSVVAQYTGALRASRTLFKSIQILRLISCELIYFGVQTIARVGRASYVQVCFLMLPWGLISKYLRFHDTTPQGMHPVCMSEALTKIARPYAQSVWKGKFGLNILCLNYIIHSRIRTSKLLMDL